MTPATLHDRSSWLYGVIVGLSIREALARVIPSLIANAHSTPEWILEVEAFRLVVFLLTIIRFYLGSVDYFQNVYVDNANSYKQKNYGLDFLVGVTHFILFFAWATTLDDIKHWEAQTRLSHFAELGGLVLLYDMFWWAASFRYDTKKGIKAWALINCSTVIICAAVFFPSFYADPRSREEIAICVVGVVGLLDIVGIISDRNLIGDMIVSVFSRKPQVA